MNQLSKKLYLAALAVALAANSAPAYSADVVPAPNPTKNFSGQKDGRHSFGTLLLMHGTEHRHIDELIAELKLEHSSPAAKQIKHLYTKAAEAKAAVVVIAKDSDSSGLYRSFQDQQGHVKITEFKVNDNGSLSDITEKKVPLAEIHKHEPLWKEMTQLKSTRPQAIMMQLEWLAKTRNSGHATEMIDSISANLSAMRKSGQIVSVHWGD